MKREWKQRGLLLLAAVCILFFMGGCERRGETVRLSQTYTSMGTVVTVVLYAQEEIAQQMQQRIREKLESLEGRLSYRLEGSEVWQLNQGEGTITLSEELYGYLTEIWSLSEKSGGALDVTLGEVTQLWNLDVYADSPEEFVPPREQALMEALARSGYERLSLQRELKLSEGMCMDLGAVGKGIACDEIRALLEDSEITAAVISVGGSNLVYGKKENDTPWTVGIAHPREEGGYLAYLELKGDTFVATSGDYERCVIKDGVRYHHIIDPGTGYPAASGVCSVTVVGDSGLLCDGLSTACFVLGAEKGAELAKTCGAEALFVEADGSVTMTEGMAELIR